MSAAEIGVLKAQERKAQEHRDRLLGYQAQNAKRTVVRDEAAEYETPEVGTNMWGSAAERARQLKLQQKVLREQEWNARPEWEKRRQVVSIDVVGGKVVKRMGVVERPREEVDDVDDEDEDGRGDVDGGVLAETSGNGESGGRGHGKGTYSNNPLLGGLIRPVYRPAKGKEVDSTGDGNVDKRRKTWRRVQDDYEDNEAIILDGGVHGMDTLDGRLGAEEHPCG